MYLEIKNVSVDFKLKSKLFKPDNLSAVNNANINIKKGEIFGLVGESGCGKSTLANSILGFIDNYQGEILIEGVPLKNNKELRKKIQVVFQDPFSSLNPRFTVRQILMEPFIISKRLDEAEEKIKELITLVGLSIDDLERNVFEFSGGQRQRIVIARAIALEPEILVCDEPVSALDVSIQAQICNLLLELHKKLNLTIIFISHNLALVKIMTNHLAVMYLGCIVEKGDTKEVFKNPSHPYTKGLIKSILPISKTNNELYKMEGEIEAPINVDKTSCRFKSRCPYKDRCLDDSMNEVKISDDHFSVCRGVLNENS